MSVLVSVVDPSTPMSLLQKQLRLEARVGIERGSFGAERTAGANLGCDGVHVRENVILKLSLTTREINVFRYRASESGSTVIDGLERFPKNDLGKPENGGGSVWRSIGWS